MPIADEEFESAEVVFFIVVFMIVFVVVVIRVESKLVEVVVGASVEVVVVSAKVVNIFEGVLAGKVVNNVWDILVVRFCRSVEFVSAILVLKD